MQHSTVIPGLVALLLFILYGAFTYGHRSKKMPPGMALSLKS